MSHLSASNFVAGDEGLALHELFDFTNTFKETAKILTLTAEDHQDTSLLSSPFTKPLKDIYDLQTGWVSPPNSDPAHSLDFVNFDDFLALDGSPNNPPIVAQTVSSATSPEVDSSNIYPAQPLIAVDNTEGLQTITELASANAEIARLQALLTAQSPQSEPTTPPRARQERNRLRKRNLVDGETPSPKRQTKTRMGPIEAMWSPSVTQNEREAFCEKLTSPKTRSISQALPNFSVSPSESYMSSRNDFEISKEDLQSMKTFIRENSGLIDNTSREVAIPAIISNTYVAPYSTNMKLKCAPLKHSLTSSPKSVVRTTDKVANKTRITPKMAKHERATPAACATSTSHATHVSHRSIEELMALNFYSLSEQEKCRVLLPMLRGHDPKELEASLAELPCIQSKGPNQHVKSNPSTQDSLPTPGVEDSFVTKLTTGTPLSPTPSKTSQSPASNYQYVPSLHKISASVDVSEDHGAMRQREALEKAALLHVHAKKR